MADEKPQPLAGATKKAAKRARPNRATQASQNAGSQTTPLKAPESVEEPETVATMDDALAAYAKGQMSLEELAQMRQGVKSERRQPAPPARAMAMNAAQVKATAQAPARQMAEGLHRLKQAKAMGVLSKGESDRAADTLIAESPNAASPAKVEIKTPRQPQAEQIVRSAVVYAGGAGLLSLGFVDILVVPGIQLRMLQNLCGLYGVTFSEEWGKNLIAALLGTATARGLAVRAVPVLGFIAAPVSNAAATWAIGKVFIQHFESGGTLLSFAPDKLKTYFAEYFQSPAPLVASTSS
jgi:uncharacterized protein (DUF697 family)